MWAGVWPEVVPYPLAMLMDLYLLATPAAPPPEMWSVAWFFELFTRHYGLDWAAFLTAGVSLWRLGERHKDGFVWGVVSNVFWIAFNFKVVSVAGVIANLFFLGIQIRAWINWNKDAKADPTHAHAADAAPTTNA